MKGNILTMLIATSILMLVTSGIAMAAPPGPVSSPIEWTGQGTDSDEDCEDENFEGAPGIHWVVNGHMEGTTDNYLLTINVSGEVVETATPFKISGKVVHFYTDYYEFDDLEATLTFTGTMAKNPQFVISHYCSGNDTEIPEFPTVALPIAAVLGLAFLLQRRKE
ncbi:PEF-CTERM sorting domain-containing protein [Methanolobus sp. ZRKC2]|uniref:PEF-CTERM sorting domain-containing protein n=1 Tax=Methanolobus sp. ZRKC2 TaxID=3125783 RepID=UPI003248E948